LKFTPYTLPVCGIGKKNRPLRHEIRLRLEDTEELRQDIFLPPGYIPALFTGYACDVMRRFDMHPFSVRISL
jgi:hypothetical protein